MLDSSDLGQDPGIGELNAGSEQLVSAGFRAFHAVPDPMASVEALSTGATPDVTSMMADPKYASLFKTLPGGRPWDMSDVPEQRDPFSMDWGQHWKQVKDMKGYDSQWKSVGDIPVPNLAWYQTLSTKGSPQEVRAWQSYLKTTGFDGADKLQSTGTWDKTTDGVMRSFLIRRFMPDYLYSRDEQQRNRTAIFLTNLGVDPTSLVSEMGRDPKFREDVLLGWLHTHGPDVGMRDTLDQFADKYGAENIPDSINGLRDNWLSKIGDSLGFLPLIGGLGGLAFGPLGSLAGAAIGEVASHLLQLPIALAETGHVGLDALYKKTSDLQADLTEHELDDAEKAQLAPALQQAHNSSGFLGFLDGWDRIRTRAVLGGAYFFGDALGQGRTQNPFDPASPSWRGAEAHQDNLMAGLFGPGRLPGVLEGVGNVLANVADDPLTYVGGGGFEAKIDRKALAETGDLASSIRRGVRPTWGQGAQRFSLLSPSTIRDQMRNGTLGKHLLDLALSPKAAAYRDMARMLGDPDLKAWDAADLLGIEDPGELSFLKATMTQDPLVRASMLASHFSERLLSPDHAFNIAEARKRLSKTYFDRLAQGKRMSILTSTSEDRSAAQLIDNPFKLTRALKDGAMTHGMTREEMEPILEGAMSDDMNLRDEAINQYYKLEETAATRWLAADEGRLSARAVAATRQLASKVTGGRISPVPAGDALARFDQWVDRLRGGRGYTENEQNRLYVPIRDENGVVVEGSKVEQRMTFDTGNPERDKMLTDAAAEARNGLNAIDDEMRRVRSRMVAEAMKGRPDTAEERRTVVGEVEESTEFQAAMHFAGFRKKTFSDQLEELAAVKGRHGAERSVPGAAVSGQFSKWGRTRYTPYEVLAYRNPYLRKLESLQQMMHIDQLHSAWKRLVLSKISSGLKINLGDEVVRIALDQLLDGGPVAFARYLKTAVERRRGAEGILDTPADLVTSIHAMLEGLHRDDFIPYAPGSLGYRRGFTHMIRNIWGNSPETKVWADAVRKAAEQTPRKGQTGYEGAVKALADWLDGGSAEAKEHLRRAQVTDGKDHRKEVERLAAGIHTQLHQFTKHSFADPERRRIFHWVADAADGKPIDERQVRDFLRRHSSDENFLPLVSGRRMRSDSAAGLGGTFNRMTDAFHTRFTDSWIRHARQTAYNAKYQQWLPEVRKAHPDWTAEQAERRAQMWAGQWLRKNTYQGQRGMMMTATRNLFPFGGATVNFDRFLMRTAAKHPWVVRPGLEVMGSSSDPQGQAQWRIPGSAWLLSHMGFAMHDDATFNPLHSFFFTSEGYGGFFPGIGPVFTFPLDQLAEHNPDIRNELQKVPGFEFVGSGAPVVPWLSDMVSGASLLATGHDPLQGVPLLGRPSSHTQRLELEAERAQHAGYLQGDTTEDASAAQGARAAGAADILGGAGSFALPVQLRAEDPRTAALAPALQAWDQAQTDKDKDAVITQFPDAAPLLRYYDPRTNLEDKARITANPNTAWVSAYSAGLTRSAASGVAGYSEPSTSAYQEDLGEGRLQLLDSDEYLDKLNHNDQFNQAWGQYDVLKTDRTLFFASHGLAPTSKVAKLYDARYFKPALDQLVAANPEWGKQFVSVPSGDAAGLGVAERPISALSTWEVMPQNSDMESPTTTAWRNLLVKRDEAATLLRELRLYHRPKVEQDQVLARFGQYADALAASDPAFAAQLGRFSTTRVQDFVELEADQQAHPS